MQAMLVIEMIGKLLSGKMVQMAILILVALGVAVFIAKKIKQNPKDVTLPDGGKGIPDGWKPNGLVKEAYEALNGIFDDVQSKTILMAKLSALTDDQLTAVYNKFGDLYYKDGGSLYDWISDEWNSGIGTQDILSRMRLLNLV